MISSTGKGGNFFEQFYDAFSFETIRKAPPTRQECTQAGMPEYVFDTYMEFIRRLYGEYFLSVNYLESKDDRNSGDSICKLINEFTNFCIYNKLALEFKNENGYRMPVIDKIFDKTFFITQFSEFPEIFHIATVDEFRLIVENILAGHAFDWPLTVLYDCNIVNIDEKDQIAHYDRIKKRMVPLSEREIHQLLWAIKESKDRVEKRVVQLEAHLPMHISSQMSIDTKLKIREGQENWLRERTDVCREQELIENCIEIIESVLECSCDEYIAKKYFDDTLYVNKGRSICQEGHHLQDATAILTVLDGHKIELHVKRCLDCGKFFIDYDLYKCYRDRYGVILGNLKFISNGDYSFKNYGNLAEESPLKLCGYSVSQANGLTEKERQAIITSCIENGTMSKHEIFRLLNFLIDMNGAKKVNEFAVKKWCDDLEFVMAYNTPKQSQYHISEIANCSANQFQVKNNGPL